MFLTYFRFALPERKENLFPVGKSNKEIIQWLKSTIGQDIYSLSQQLVLQKIEKKFLRNEKTVTEEVKILRKSIALEEIGKYLLIDHKEHKTYKWSRVFRIHKRTNYLKPATKW